MDENKLSRDELKRFAESLSSQFRQTEEQLTKTDLQNFAGMLAQRFSETMEPMISGLREEISTNREESRTLMVESLNDIADSIADIQVNIPEMKAPMVPEPKVTVNVPPLKQPVVNVPEFKMPDGLKVLLDRVDSKNPLPVSWVDGSGKPMSFPVGAGGGKADFFTIKDIQKSGVSIITNDGELKTTGSFSASLSADYGEGEIGDNTLRTVAATDAIWSVNVVSGSTAGTEYNDGGTANPPAGTAAMVSTGEESGNMFVMRSGSGATDSTVLRVVHATDVGVTVAAAELTAIQTAVEIMDDWDETNRAAVNVISGQAAVAADEGEADARTVRVVHAGDVGVTVAAAELTAIQTAVEIMDDWDETDRAKVNLITSQAGIAADEGEADGRTVRVVHAGDVGVTVAASELTAIQTAVQIMDDWDAVHDSAAVSDGPQIMAEARTTNPTAVDNGDAVRPRADDLGRLVTRPHQARDLMATAYVSLSNGTETTLLSGAASTLHDLIYVTCANQSDAATYVDFRCGTAGSVVLTVEIPAEATAGVALPSPIPMPEVAQAWTVDMPDITGTTIDISALFSKEV